jgi:hypothetical protein
VTPREDRRQAPVSAGRSGSLTGARADLVTAPLLPDERISAVLLDRYDATLGGPGGS